ncbi:MAG: DUF1592 domain-containing protein [Pirellulaceae bacterium]
MNSSLTLLISICLAAACFADGARAAESLRDDPAFAHVSRQLTTHVRPLLVKYCLECHGDEQAEAELNLAAQKDLAAVLQSRRMWQRMAEVLLAQQMPPEEKPQPSGAERELIARFAESVLDLPEPDGRRNPGEVALRRLNQVEYNNTVFDLFGLNKPRTYFDPRRGMPETVRLVLHRNQRPIVVALPPDDVGYGYDNIGEVLSLPPFLMEKYFAAARQVVDAAEDGGRLQATINRSGRFTSDEQRARFILDDFARRAFRRPVPDGEVERYMKLYRLAVERGEPLPKALKVPLAAMLVSPHFLFRVESGDIEQEENGVRPLTDHELAARLSYFLWSSMPDDELSRLADEGKLRDPQVLEAQVRRMLLSPKAKELAENFALQWLQVSNLEGAMPAPDLFPEFYRQKYLPHAMRQEALLLFETIMTEDRGVTDLIDAEYTWLNGTLAGFYGIDEAYARERNSGLFWKRYELPDKRRGGVLTMGGPLLAMSNSTRTNPVKRGKWVLETLLGDPPPPPLANVPDLDETPAAEDGLSLRDKLERHRADPACAACHRRMDPLGLGLENYNAIGAWREKEGPVKIDAAGTLTDGTTFQRPEELKEILVTSRKAQFYRCLSEHLLTYALGRPLDYYDRSAVNEIVEELKRDEGRFSTLVVAVVMSYPFRNINAPPVHNEE